MINYQPPQTEPKIIYLDDDLIIVDKPPELLTVPGRRPEHRDCLLSRIQLGYPEALIVHRLDMSTSGLLILARNNTAHRHLNRQFELRQVKKIYLAVVSGRIEPAAGEINLPLNRDWPNRPRQIIDHERGKPAQTDYRLVQYDSATDTSRVELRPFTGRTHQLRVHMQALGHPILGDDLYADAATLNQADRLLLHAAVLELTHPTTAEVIRFCCDVPF